MKSQYEYIIHVSRNPVNLHIYVRNMGIPIGLLPFLAGRVTSN